VRYPKEHKEQTRRHIVESAGRLFRRQGYLGSGIDAVMEEAGLTAGAFYRHFASKEELLEEVLRVALQAPPPGREQGLEELEGEAWVRGLVENYLSAGHRASVEDGCPLPALTPELARSGRGCRDAFEQGLHVWKRQIVEQLQGFSEDREEVALGLIAAMVGGMALARGLPPEQAEILLSGARKVALRSLEEKE
jgi:TetR/AcrR family transcriptional repressor of nem operon